MVFATKSPSRWCLEFLLIKGWVRLRLRGLGFDEAVEQDRLLVKKGALV